MARLETLTRDHAYDGLTFFRVIEDFMDQTGDPKNTGEGASSLPNIKAEFNFKATPGFTVVSHPDNGGDAGFIGVMPVVSQPAALAALTADGRVNASSLFCPGRGGHRAGRRSGFRQQPVLPHAGNQARAGRENIPPSAALSPARMW